MHDNYENVLPSDEWFDDLDDWPSDYEQDVVKITKTSYKSDKKRRWREIFRKNIQ